MHQNKLPNKKLKTNEESKTSSNIYFMLSQQLLQMQHLFNDRIHVLEKKIDILIDNKEKENIEHKCCTEVLKKFTIIEQLMKTMCQMSAVNKDYNNEINEDKIVAPIVLLPSDKTDIQGDFQLDLDSSIQVITLNNESDYPNGCWLGDDTNTEARVRVPITPEQLLHINTHCSTPEKMATVLLDYLFPQDVQAVSNLSGKGKHCKKQLDPLKIYAIRSHLIHLFNISDRHWHRIRQNLDSKCRSAWRKKAKGIPLTNNKFLNAATTSSSCDKHKDGDLEEEEESFVVSEEFVDNQILEDDASENVEVSQKQYKILRATPEQLAKLQELRGVKVYTDEDTEQLLTGYTTEDANYLTLTGHDEVLIVTDSNEVISPELITGDCLNSDQSSSTFLT